MILASEQNLLAASLALGATRVKGWSPGELRLIAEVEPLTGAQVRSLRDEIRAGEDPLGDAFCVLRSPRERRRLGATYTPAEIVRAMVTWARRHRPARVVDPGSGSGRFLLQAGRTFPRSELIGFEVDPLAAIIARANLAASGLERRARIVLCDYRKARLEPIPGKTLFIGNPPYVRHHDLDADSKRWLSREARRRGLPASQLAGLHVHFFLATTLLARPGDYGAFITSAEWLDVNYGVLVRALLLNGLGGDSITLLDPKLAVFPDAQTTAAITTFIVGARERLVTFRRVSSLRDLELSDLGRAVPVGALEHTARWSAAFVEPKARTQELVPLGELCRVHRGQVTGCNEVWIAGPHSRGLPARVLHPAITRAKEIIVAGGTIRTCAGLKLVIDLPADLGAFNAAERAALERFLEYAHECGADRTYIARHRQPWWSVRLLPPAPVLATYMARRPPVFALNEAGVRHLNIAHGLYPREPLPAEALRRLVAYLSTTVCQSQGRTYAGGLTKFEPREMERLLVPSLDVLVRSGG